jgi:long-chain acyl-CoA synthetase
MVMRMMRDLDAETLSSALDDGLKSNHSPAELAELKPQADQLSAIMKGIGKAREGDTIGIDFSADGVAVSLNGEVRGKVAGAGFAKALLKVWLGDKPVDASLKKALLGS